MAASHIVTGPDGKEYELTIPEGATPDQIKAAGTKAMQAITAAQPPSLGQRAISAGANIFNNLTDPSIAQDVVSGGIIPAMAKSGASMLQMAGSDYNPIGRLLPQSWRAALQQQGLEAEKVADERYEQAGPMALPGAMLPELLGAGKAFTPVKAGVEELIKRSPQFLQKTIKPGVAPYASAAISEGASSALFNPDDPLYAGGLSALAGPVGLKLGQVISKGAPRAADVDILTSQDVPLTVGQAADKRTYAGRVLKRFEEGLTKLPLVGDLIRLRQQEALDAARRAAVKRGDVPEEFIARNASPAGPVRPPAPMDKAGMSVDQLIEQQAKDYAKVYGEALQNKTIRADPQGFKNIQNIIDDPDLALIDSERDAIRDIVRRRLIETLQHTGNVGKQPKNFKQLINMKPNQMPWWDSETLMKNQASLRKVGYRFSQSPDPARRDMGFALKDVADELYDVISRQDVEAGKLLEAIRAPYSAHRTVSSAALRAPKIGEFTMPQLAKQAEKSGNEWLTTFARQGSESLPLTVPTGDSSTSMLMSIIAASVAPKLALGAAAAGSTFGTKYGQKVLQGQTGWQHGMAEQLRKIGVD